MTSIGSGAFLACSGLTGPLTIPESVISIGERAFVDCRFSTIRLLNPVPTAYGTDMFNSGSTIHIPTGSRAAYEREWADGNYTFIGK